MYLQDKAVQFMIFLLYQSTSTEINADLQKQFGIGSATVLQLTERVKKNSHF